MHSPKDETAIPSRRLVWGTIGFVEPTQMPPKSHFIKGPIPMAWITIAACLPGKALQVALLLWYRKGLCRSNVVILTNKICASLGVNRFQKARALTALENAGLVNLTRVPGRNPRVEILVDE